ncbi:MAG: VapC toxin family PIN domain ribonuclease [Planctomycetaceae bacterium]|nr:VapC toxin family PIN domain ribonuclease [Planctomycetaceae bacterium]
MPGKHLLDTNIVVALFKDDKEVRKQLSASTEVFLPSIVIGELYYGARHSAHVERNMTQVQELAKAMTVLACDADTAEYYGEVKNDLKVKGNPSSENDVWIAAVAKQHLLTVVTRDQHFKAIGGLGERQLITYQ